MTIRLNQFAKCCFSLIFFIYFSCIGATAICQNVIIDSIQKSLVQYRQQNLQEKLYVHTDKTTYVAGEVIWFKIYYIDGYLHRPLDISKVAYVEILDGDGKPVLQSKIELGEGSGNSKIQIPFNINTGNYTLAAYTAWMKNFNPQFFYRQPIMIINTLKRPDWKSIEKKIEFDFQLFPEGGHLVQGLESKVAFRITDSTGKGIKAKGVVINGDSDTVLTFGTHQFGLGQFLFTPLHGHQYKAVALLEDGTRILKDFPLVNEEGIVMKIIDNNVDDLEINVTGHKASDTIHLVGHCRQLSTVNATQVMSNNNVSFKISKSKLGDGINHFTIFNGSLQPLCERLYFKPPRNILSIQASIPKKIYQKREKVNIAIASFTKLNMPVSTPFSASVHLVDSISDGLKNNILSYLFLTSELKGSVEEPSYYFSEKSTDVIEATDNLMLVHGWSRISWQSIFTEAKTADFLPEYEGHIINATLVNKITRNVAGNIPVYFATLNNNLNLGHFESNKDGRLLFVTRNLYGPQKLVFPINRPDDSLFTIEVQTPYSNKHVISKMLLPSISKKNEAQLIQYNKSVQIQHSYNDNQGTQISTSPVDDKNAFFGRPDRTYWLDDYTRFTTMEEVLREYVSEVHIKKNRTGFDFALFNTPYLKQFEANPLILLDGEPVFDNNKILNLNPLKIQKIEVIARKYFLGALTFYGIVSYSSYPDSLLKQQITTHARVIDYKGLQTTQEFFNPVYEYKTQKENRIPDFRNVLTWAPNMQTDKEGKGNLSFYTSDLTGKYVIIIQGITTDGLPGLTTLELNVSE